MPPPGIVQPLDVPAHGRAGVRRDVPCLPPEQLKLQGRKETLDHGAIVAVPRELLEQINGTGASELLTVVTVSMLRAGPAVPTPLLSPQLARSVTRVNVEVERPWARPFRLDTARRDRS